MSHGACDDCGNARETCECEAAGAEISAAERRVHDDIAKELEWHAHRTPSGIAAAKRAAAAIDSADEPFTVARSILGRFDRLTQETYLARIGHARRELASDRRRRWESLIATFQKRGAL